MKKIYTPFSLTSISLAAALMFAGWGVRAQKNRSGAGAEVPKTASQAFKNIQVLKDIPANQLIPAMQFIAASLGVECEYCHVEGQFQSDDKKPKTTAREMMKMMITINQENFEGKREVTCFSCHRGATRPVATPIIPTEQQETTIAANAEGGGPPSSSPKTAPKIDDILSRYLQASGGEAAIEKVTSRLESGTLTTPEGQNAVVDVMAKAPDKREVLTHGKRGDSVTAFDGQVGWMSAPGRPVRMMSPPDVEATQVDADLHLPVNLKMHFTSLKVDGVEKVGDNEVRVVIAEKNDHLAAKLYFDEKSGLLIRILHFTDSPLGFNPVQIDFADYRDVDGVKVPFRWTVARPSGRFTIAVDSLKQNVPIPDASFAQPKVPEAQSHP